MSLKEIFCQDRAIDILQRAFASGKVPHSYIFAGPDGVGKFRTAQDWARLLLCNEPVTENGFADSCGLCESCRLFGGDAHPDFAHIRKELLEFTRDNKGRAAPVEMPVDVVREFLIEKVSARPTLSQRRLFIVSEAEKLNIASQNALLKVLEEPPGFCCIVLLCTRLDRLLPTTRSRCQIVRFGPVDEDRIVEKLKAMGIEGEQAQYFARLAGGSIGRACKWAELGPAGADIYAMKRKVISRISGFRYAETLDLAEGLLADGKALADVWAKLETGTSRSDINRRAQKTLIQIIISALHDAMKSAVGVEDETVNFDQRQEVLELVGRFDTEQLTERIGDCHRALRWIELGVNEKLIFERLLFGLAGSDIMWA